MLSLPYKEPRAIHHIRNNTCRKFHFNNFINPNFALADYDFSTTQAAESLAQSLVKAGFKAKPYHAGLDKTIRTDIQDKFLRSNDMIVSHLCSIYIKFHSDILTSDKIVGTIAFGMGIDKENVRTIIHFDLPSSIEAYSQQIGRAGRDGRPSTCLLYLSNKDFFLRNILIHGEKPSKFALRSLFDEICSTENCRLRAGDAFSVSLNAQSRRVDIKVRNSLFPLAESAFLTLRRKPSFLSSTRTLS